MCLLCVKVAREIDDFFISLARTMPSNKNVELGGRDGFKFFKHGVTSYLLPKVRRIITRQLKTFFVSPKLCLQLHAPSFVTR
jgi:hypothetical protein